jgi:hypothetical protein
MINENTDLNNPKLGNLRWSYGVSQREIIAKYNNWQLKGIYDMSKSGNYVFLEIVHSSGYKNQIYDTGLSDFLFKIF